MKLVIVSVLVIVLPIALLIRMGQYSLRVRHACASAGFPQVIYGRNAFDVYCVKRENGTDVIVPASTVMR